MNNTLAKGLRVLEALARSREPRGVSDLANQLGLPKSNVHRLLQGLVTLRYAQQDERRGTYSASMKIWEIGSQVAARVDLKTAAQASMEELLDSTRETVHLSVLDGDEVVYVHKLDSPEPVRAYSEIGGRAPAHCVATGKALLSHQLPRHLDQLSRRLARHTPATITEPEKFLKEMDRVMRQGYAINRGEWRETVWGVGAPVVDAEGRVVAAIGVSGPAGRIKGAARLRALAAAVRKASEAVSKRLVAVG